MSFKEFLRKACTVGLSASMLFSFSPSQIKAVEGTENTADTIKVDVKTGEGKLVTITRPNGINKVRIQMFSDLKYSKNLKQRLIDYIVSELKSGEELWLRYLFTDTEGTLKKISSWKKYDSQSPTSILDSDDLKAEEEGRYDIRYIIVDTSSS